MNKLTQEDVRNLLSTLFSGRGTFLSEEPQQFILNNEDGNFQKEGLIILAKANTTRLYRDFQEEIK